MEVVWSTAVYAAYTYLAAGLSGLGYPTGKIAEAILILLEREKTLASPPDILLTNYVMLELMLTRPKERKALNLELKALGELA